MKPCRVREVVKDDIIAAGSDPIMALGAFEKRGSDGGREREREGGRALHAYIHVRTERERKRGA